MLSNQIQTYYSSNLSLTEDNIFNVIKNLDISHFDKDTILIIFDNNENRVCIKIFPVSNKKKFFKNILNTCLNQKCKSFILIKFTDFLITSKIKEEIRQDALILKEASLSIDLEFESFILISINDKS